MRLLHTSDWHLGRTLAQESLLDDQAHLIEQVFTALRDGGADALILAGDIFDRPNPRREAIGLFSDFLRRVFLDTQCAIVALAGNHDAPERISFNSALHDPGRVLIRGPLSDRPDPLVLRDVHGEVAISALPFSEIFAARDAFVDDTLRAPADVMVAQLAQARAGVPVGARWVVAAHAFVAGGRVSDSERPLSQVGGLETVPSEAFDGAAYVALGHLHRPQSVGADHIRYCGSWMGFGFDEAGEEKSLSLVDIGAQDVTVEMIALRPRRALRVITGDLQDVIAAGRLEPEPARQALIKAVLTDPGALINPMDQLRAVYPHVLQIERRRPAVTGEQGGVGVISADRQDPARLVDAFLCAVRGAGVTQPEHLRIAHVLADLQSMAD